MRLLPIALTIGVALLLLGAAPAAGFVAMPNLYLPDESVTVLNFGQETEDLAGWTITDDGAPDTYTFPTFTLAPWQWVTVHAGPGADNETNLFRGLPTGHTPVWNHDGDLVTLRNASGVRVADSTGFILGAPTYTPVTTMPVLTIPVPHPPVSPYPSPYITTPPTGVASHGPIMPPYPTTVRTLAPGEGPTTVPTIPIPREPPYGILLPTSTLPQLLPTHGPGAPIGLPGPVLPVLTSPIGGRRYAIGTPGSFLGGRFGSVTPTITSGGPRPIPSRRPVIGPGTDPYGVTPPASGAFVRWYPATRWASGLR
jgi:hypothetical protein